MPSVPIISPRASPRRKAVPAAPWARVGSAMVRAIWALALALALLVVQSEGSFHLLGHAGELLQGKYAASIPGLSGGAENDDGYVADVCLQCLALSGVDTPLAGSSPARAHHATTLRPAVTAALPAPGLSLLRPRCRAPPALFPFALLA